MKKIILALAISAIAANAALVSVSNNPSNGPAGVACSNVAAIIAAPISVANNAPGAENCAQQGFDERQGVLLLVPLGVFNGGSIAAGTAVDSHMIFLNTASTPQNNISHLLVHWTFSSVILGIMSDVDGNLEAGSSGFLGAPGTFYPAAFPSTTVL